MVDDASMSADEVAAAARAAEQARLRKERREAKIKSGGASRLNRITGLGGGLQRDSPPAPASSAPDITTEGIPSTLPQQEQQQPLHHPDPDEVDISQHFYAPRTTTRLPQSPSPSPFFSSTPPPGAAGAAGADMDDPMMRMMMQMVGGGNMPGSGGDGSDPFASFFPQAAQQAQAQGAPSPFSNLQQQQQLRDRYAALWRLLHTAVALGLGLYIAVWTSFGGTRLERERARNDAAVVACRTANDEKNDVASAAQRFFWAFATVEAVLLTTRFFVDGGRRRTVGVVASGGSSALSSLARFLPSSVGGPVEMVLRYGSVLGTVRADVSVCVFVLGVVAWLRSSPS